MNIKTLKLKKGKKYAEVMFFGDSHIGSKFCEIEKVKEALQYCLDNNIYIAVMGDIIEASSRHSVADGVYQQDNPQKQIDDVKKLFKPLSDKGLILSWLRGNHCGRIINQVGIDISKVICDSLKVPYLGGAGFSLYKVGNQNYSAYLIHGRSSAKTRTAKMKVASTLAQKFIVDMFVHAHMHENSFDLQGDRKQYIDLKNKTIKSKDTVTIVSGHYLQWKQSYAQEAGMSPSSMGSPIIKLYGDKHKIEARLRS